MNGISSFSLSDQLGEVSLVFEWAVVGTELFAIALLLLGLGRFTLSIIGGEMHRKDAHERSHRLNLGRLELGRYILTGLEVLIIADLIRTMLDLTFENILLLGGLVAIRSLISFFLERELTHLKDESRERNAMARGGGGAGDGRCP